MKKAYRNHYKLLSSLLFRIINRNPMIYYLSFLFLISNLFFFIYRPLHFRLIRHLHGLIPHVFLLFPYVFLVLVRFTIPNLQLVLVERDQAWLLLMTVSFRLTLLFSGLDFTGIKTILLYILTQQLFHPLVHKLMVLKRWKPSLKWVAFIRLFYIFL